MKKKRNGALSKVGVAIAAIALMTLGVPTSANAVLGSYYVGPSFQNQTHASATTYMSGGNSFMTPDNGLLSVVVTVADVGDFAGLGSVDFNFTGRTTWQYCKWTYTSTISDVPQLACRYRY